MPKKLSEKELVDLIASFVLENCSEMPSTNDFEKAYLKLEQLSEFALKRIKEKLK